MRVVRWLIALLIVAVMAIAFVPMFLDLATDDVDAHGIFTIPSEQVVTLPEGTHGVHYREQRALESAGPNRGSRALPLAPGLTVEVLPVEGGPAPELLDVRGSFQSSTVDDRSTRQIHRLEIPAEGRYLLRVGGDASGLEDAAVTIGTNRDDGSLERSADLLQRIVPYLAPAILGLVALGIVASIVRGRRRQARLPVAVPSPAAAPPPQSYDVKL